MWKLDSGSKRELVGLLKQLVAIPSVNLGASRGRSDKPEREIAQFISRYLVDQVGMRVTQKLLAPGRPNISGRWPGRPGKAGSKGGKSLMLTAHMDTVNVEGMTIDPFAGRQKMGESMAGVPVIPRVRWRCFCMFLPS